MAARFKRHTRRPIEGLEPRVLCSLSPAAIGPALLSPSQAYVQVLYQDLLQRPADPAGLAFWSGALDHGASRAAVVHGLLTSAEYATNVVTGFYQQLLNRAPEAAGLAQWVTDIQAGVDPEIIRDGIIGSDEYYLNHHSDDLLYVTAVYHDILSRAPDIGGLYSFANSLNHTNADKLLLTRTLAAKNISYSVEHEQQLVSGFYTTYLLRAPDAAGLDLWVSALGNNARENDIIAAFLTSPEFLTANNIAP